jgi:hypothetical protein
LQVSKAASIMKLLSSLLLLSFQASSAFDYSIVGGGGLVLDDVKTGIGGLLTLFTDEFASVTVDGIEWEATGTVEDSDDLLFWKTFVNGELQASGNVSLADVARELPTSIGAGEVKVTKSGRYTVSVEMMVDGSSASSENEYEAYGSGVSIIPLLVVLGLAVTTQMVEFSLFTAIFVGACMVSGNVIDGFMATLDNYVLNAFADVGHGYVFLFTMFLS